MVHVDICRNSVPVFGAIAVLGDLVRRLIAVIFGVIIWPIGVINRTQGPSSRTPFFLGVLGALTNQWVATSLSFEFRVWGGQRLRVEGSLTRSKRVVCWW